MAPGPQVLAVPAAGGAGEARRQGPPRVDLDDVVGVRRVGVEHGERVPGVRRRRRVGHDVVRRRDAVPQSRAEARAGQSEIDVGVVVVAAARRRGRRSGRRRRLRRARTAALAARSGGLGLRGVLLLVAQLADLLLVPLLHLALLLLLVVLLEEVAARLRLVVLARLLLPLAAGLLLALLLARLRAAADALGRLPRLVVLARLDGDGGARRHGGDGGARRHGGDGGARRHGGDGRRAEDEDDVATHIETTCGDEAVRRTRGAKRSEGRPPPKSAKPTGGSHTRRSRRAAAGVDLGGHMRTILDDARTVSAQACYPTETFSSSPLRKALYDSTHSSLRNEKPRDLRTRRRASRLWDLR